MNYHHKLVVGVSILSTSLGGCALFGGGGATGRPTSGRSGSSAATSAPPDAPLAHECLGITPIRAVIGSEMRYSFQDGLVKEEEKGFEVRVPSATPDSGCHYVINTGECLVIDYNTADIDPHVRQGSLEEQFILQDTGVAANQVPGPRVINGSIDYAALIGRCPKDFGFGCANGTVSPRRDYATSQLAKSGVTRNVLCTSPVTNGHQALGGTFFGGRRKASENKFLFTASWRVTEGR